MARKLVVALARCRSCRRRSRVLPSDVLPAKRYTLAVIERLTRAHVVDGRSLRQVAWTELHGESPVHSTVHAWTEGFGAFGLGRQPGELPAADRCDAAIVETQRRRPAVDFDVDPAAVVIDPRRYRSVPRLERLVMVARLLLLAARVAVGHDLPWCAWRALAVGFGLALPLTFRTGLSSTGFEHRVSRVHETRALPLPNGGSRCPIRTRSPPGASSRSHPSSTRPSTAPPNDA